MEDFLPDYHFIAIGGIGQSALAKILLEEGKKVSGSDISDTKYTKKLKELGAKIYLGNNSQNIKGSPVVVVSSTIHGDNPEITEAKKRGLKIIHRSDMLKIISKNYPCFLGFCGTHGKTTTIGLCAFLLSHANLKPAYAIGGIIPELNTNGGCEDKNTKYFAAELDESDGTIVKYSPDFILINNLEADHPDFYKNGLSDILDTFSTFLNGLKNNAKVIINLDNEGNRELIAKNAEFKNFIGFALESSDAKYFAKNIKFDVLSSSFDVFKKDDFIGHIDLSIPGLHNVLNALSVIAVALYFKLDFNLIKDELEKFNGVERRFQFLKTSPFTIIHDYAHHPTEIKETLKTAKLLNKNKVVCIFEPHTYSRTKSLMKEFCESFYDADKLYLLPTYSAREQPIKDGSSFDLFLNLPEEIDCEYYEDKNKLFNQLLKTVENDDLIIFLGAGTIGEYSLEFLKLVGNE